MNTVRRASSGLMVAPCSWLFRSKPLSRSWLLCLSHPTFRTIESHIGCNFKIYPESDSLLLATLWSPRAKQAIATVPHNCTCVSPTPPPFHCPPPPRPVIFWNPKLSDNRSNTQSGIKILWLLFHCTAWNKSQSLFSDLQSHTGPTCLYFWS